MASTDRPCIPPPAPTTPEPEVALPPTSKPPRDLTPTLPPPTEDEWLAGYPEESYLRTPCARAALKRLGVFT